jgi:hypothetical protein
MSNLDMSIVPKGRTESGSNVLELAALAIFPIFVAGNKLLSCGCFAIYLISKIYRHKEYLLRGITNHRFVSSMTLILAGYILSKGNFDGPTMTHMLTDSTLYPVTILDYLIFLLVPLLISIIPVRAVELFLIAASCAISVILHLIVGIYFEDGFKFLAFGNSIPLFEITPGWPDRSRTVAGFSNPNITAFFALLSTVASLALAKATYAEIKCPSVAWPMVRQPLFSMILGLLGVVSGSTLVVFSGSRASLGVFFLVTILASIFYRSRLGFGALMGLGLLVILQISGKLVHLGLNLPGITFSRLSAMLGNVQSTEAERINIYSCFWNESLQDPLLGQGIFHSAINCENWAKYRPYGFNHGHNIFLHPLSELGFPATILLLTVVLWLFYRGSKLISMRDVKNTTTGCLRIGFLLASIAGIGLSMTSLAMFHWYPLLLMFSLFLVFACAPLYATNNN